VQDKPAQQARDSLLRQPQKQAVKNKAKTCDLKMKQSTILTSDQLMTGIDRNVIATTGHQDQQLRKGITTNPCA
jgi:hypothetical protein